MGPLLRPGRYDGRNFTLVYPLDVMNQADNILVNIRNCDLRGKK
jgi:hypothetical protein